MEHTAKEAAERVAQAERHLDEVRRELIAAIQHEADRGIKPTRIAADTGLSRYTVYKHIKTDLSGDDQGKANEPVLMARAA